MVGRKVGKAWKGQPGKVARAERSETDSSKVSTQRWQRPPKTKFMRSKRKLSTTTARRPIRGVDSSRYDRDTPRSVGALTGVAGTTKAIGTREPQGNCNLGRERVCLSLSVKTTADAKEIRKSDIEPDYDARIYQEYRRHEGAMRPEDTL